MSAWNYKFSGGLGAKQIFIKLKCCVHRTGIHPSMLQGNEAHPSPRLETFWIMWHGSNKERLVSERPRPEGLCRTFKGNLQGQYKETGHILWRGPDPIKNVTTSRARRREPDVRARRREPESPNNVESPTRSVQKQKNLPTWHSLQKKKLESAHRKNKNLINITKCKRLFITVKQRLGSLPCSGGFCTIYTTWWSSTFSEMLHVRAFWPFTST